MELFREINESVVTFADQVALFEHYWKAAEKILTAQPNLGILEEAYPQDVTSGAPSRARIEVPNVIMKGGKVVGVSHRQPEGMMAVDDQSSPGVLRSVVALADKMDKINPEMAVNLRRAAKMGKVFMPREEYGQERLPSRRAGERVVRQMSPDELERAKERASRLELAPM